MFGISDAIACEPLMVQGTLGRTSQDLLGPSRWSDVKSGEGAHRAGIERVSHASRRCARLLGLVSAQGAGAAHLDLQCFVGADSSVGSSAHDLGDGGLRPARHVHLGWAAAEAYRLPIIWGLVIAGVSTIGAAYVDDIRVAVGLMAVGLSAANVSSSCGWARLGATPTDAPVLDFSYVYIRTSNRVPWPPPPLPSSNSPSICFTHTAISFIPNPEVAAGSKSCGNLGHVGD